MIMADTGEDRQIRTRLESNEKERFRAAQQLTTKVKEANSRRAPSLKPVVDPHLFPADSIPGLRGDR